MQVSMHEKSPVIVPLPRACFSPRGSSPLHATCPTFHSSSHPTLFGLFLWNSHLFPFFFLFPRSYQSIHPLPPPPTPCLLRVSSTWPAAVSDSNCDCGAAARRRRRRRRGACPARRPAGTGTPSSAWAKWWVFFLLSSSQPKYFSPLIDLPYGVTNGLGLPNGQEPPGQPGPPRLARTLRRQPRRHGTAGSGHQQQGPFSFSAIRLKAFGWLTRPTVFSHRMLSEEARGPTRPVAAVRLWSWPRARLTQPSLPYVLVSP